MSELRELENSNAMGINAMYYKGEKKKEFLENRNKTLSQLPKGIVLGFGYTIWGQNVYDGQSIDDVDYSETVTEYVFMKSPDKNDSTIYFENIAYMIFCEKSKDSNGVQLDDYVKELETSGYIKMPVTFRREKSAEDMKKELSLAKCKK